MSVVQVPPRLIQFIYAEKLRTSVQKVDELELRLQKEVHTNEELVRSIDCQSFIHVTAAAVGITIGGH